MAQHYLRKYGAAATIDFVLFEVDGVDFRVDALHAAGDTKIMKDEGAEANTTNGFTDEGQGYSLVLTATEMQAARIVVYVVDAATKAWLDTSLMIETYGNASAQHAVDLDDSVRAGLTALPNAVADAAGGLAISDAGGLDLDAKLANTNEVTAARMGALTDWINGGRLDLLLDAIPTTAMRGTDGALTDKAGFSLSTAGILAVWHQALTAIVTAGSVGKLIKDEVTAARMATLTDWINGGRLDLLLDAIPTTAMRGTDGVDISPMRGTDNAALASVLGALANAAAAGDPTATDTLVAYVKQLINILIGTAGIVTFPAEAAPANAISLAEVIRAIHVDVTGLNGDAMRGTDGANTATPLTAAQVGIAKNAAFSNFEFLMIDSTDDVSPKTGLTVTGQRSIDGGAFAAVSGTITEVANGIYQFDALAADTNGDVITWRFTGSGANDRFFTFKTI